MNANDFAEATGYLRTVEKKMLTAGNIDRLIDTADGSEALKMLSQSSELDFSALERVDDYETVLKAELKRVYDLLYNICPNPLVVDVLSAKYDFHNMKVAVKAHVLNEDFESLYVHITETTPRMICDAVSGADRKSLPEYTMDALDAALRGFEETKDPQMVDLVLDKLMFARILELCEALDNDFITGYVRTQIDFYNAKTLLRVKSMEKGMKFLDEALAEGGTSDKDLYLNCYDKPLEGVAESFVYKYFSHIMRDTIDNFEKTGNYSAMEKLTDNYLLELAKATNLIAFGPEPVFAYVVGKENEIKQIRLLITCKANNITADVLKERLRDNYA